MIWNLFLMLVWAAFWNNFSAHNLLVGFVVGYLCLSVFASRVGAGPSGYLFRTRRTIAFIGFYLQELWLSNLQIARMVLTRDLAFRSAIVGLPLDEKMDTSAEITLLANLISLTPGSLSLDVSQDRRTLYLHALDVPKGDIEAFKAKIKYDFERRVIEVLHT